MSIGVFYILSKDEMHGNDDVHSGNNGAFPGRTTSDVIYPASWAASASSGMSVRKRIEPQSTSITSAMPK